jgi:hypothetical protein
MGRKRVDLDRLEVSDFAAAVNCLDFVSFKTRAKTRDQGKTDRHANRN